jgi:renin receptor
MASTVGGFVALISLLSVLAQTVIAGDFMVLRCPKYVHFLPDANAIETSEISPLIAASFGLSLRKDLQWNGLQEVSLFQRPKATALFSVTGVPDGRLDAPNVASYKTVEVENSLNTAELSDNINGIDWKKDPLVIEFSADADLFDITSRYPGLFTGLPSTLAGLGDDVATGSAPRWFHTAQLASLNMTQEADFRFVSELYVVQEIIHTLVESKAKVKTNSPDFFHFQIAGLDLIMQTYGADSVQYGDALRLLKDVVAHVADELQLLYSDNVVVELVTFSPEASLKPSSRRGRSLLASDVSTETGTDENPLNLAPYFSEMYSAIFNICLWIMIGFGLAIFFISWGIWNMDPGRDSIIYRMTSQRMKRD